MSQTRGVYAATLQITRRRAAPQRRRNPDACFARRFRPPRRCFAFAGGLAQNTRPSSGRRWSQLPDSASRREAIAAACLLFRVRLVEPHHSQGVRMNFHEYQAKELFAGYGIPVPAGKVASTPEQAAEAAKALGGDQWVVKAQIHAGGRGKAGGVKLCKTPEEVKTAAAGMLGTRHDDLPVGRPRTAGQSGADQRGERHRQGAVPFDPGRSREQDGRLHRFGARRRRHRAGRARKPRRHPYDRSRFRRRPAAVPLPPARVRHGAQRETGQSADQDHARPVSPVQRAGSCAGRVESAGDRRARAI